MTTVSKFSGNQLESLLELLPEISARIKSNQKFSPNTFKILLMSLDLETDEIYVHELQKWVELLQLVRQDPSNGEDVISALKLRGVPEASAVLAVQDVIKVSEPKKNVGQNIQLSTKHIDFGEVLTGKSVTKEIEILSGSGVIKNENEFLKISSQEFKKGDIIKITAQGGQEGQILFDNKIIFQNENESVALGVSIQWIEKNKENITSERETIENPPQTFFSVVDRFPQNIERDPFETEKEYSKRIESQRWIYAGEAFFSPKDYDKANGILELRIEQQPWVQELKENLTLPERIKLNISLENLIGFYYAGKIKKDNSFHPLIIKLGITRKRGIFIASTLIIPYTLSLKNAKEILDSLSPKSKIIMDDFLNGILTFYKSELKATIKEGNDYSQGIFETKEMYKKRLNKMVYIKAGKVLFDKNKYNVNSEEFPYSVKLDQTIASILERDFEQNGVLHLKRDIAKKFWAAGRINDAVAEHGLVIKFGKNLDIQDFCIVPFPIYQKQIEEIKEEIEQPATGEELLASIKYELKNKIGFLLKTMMKKNHPPKELSYFNKLHSNMLKNLVMNKFEGTDKTQVKSEVENLLQKDSYLSVFLAYCKIHNFVNRYDNHEFTKSLTTFKKLVQRLDKLVTPLEKENQLSSNQMELLNKILNKVLVDGEEKDIERFINNIKIFVDLIILVNQNEHHLSNLSASQKEKIKRFFTELSVLENTVTKESSNVVLSKISEFLIRFPSKEFQINILYQTKKCPYCGKLISAAAIKCKHCKKWLTEDRKPIQGLERIIYTYLSNENYLYKKIQQSGVFYSYLAKEHKTQKTMVKKVIVSYKQYGCINKNVLDSLIKQINKSNLIANSSFVPMYHGEKLHPVPDLTLYSFDYPYIEGMNLAEAIQKEKKFSYNSIKDIVIKIINALNNFYQKTNSPFGSLHPNNIILVENKIKLTPGLRYYEFVGQANTPYAELTPIYLNQRFFSSEQILDNKTSFKSDIYSIGVILFELQTNKPFTKENLMNARNSLGSFGKIIEKAVKDDPDERWENIAEIKSELQTTSMLFS